MSIVWVRSLEGNESTAIVGTGLRLTVNQQTGLPESEPTYDVIVFDDRLPTRSHTMESGQTEATNVAITRLRDALQGLIGQGFEIKVDSGYIEHTDTPRELTEKEIQQIREARNFIAGIILHRELTHSTLKAAAAIVKEIQGKADGSNLLPVAS